MLILRELHNFIINNMCIDEFIINENLNMLELETWEGENKINLVIEYLENNFKNKYEIVLKYHDFLRVQFKEDIKLYPPEFEKEEKEILLKELKEFNTKYGGL